MGELDLKVKVVARDSLGHYLAKIHREAVATVEDVSRASAAFARAREPVKTGALRASTQAVLTGGTSGGVVFGTNHWRYQDEGTSVHDITGNVSFFWAKEGRQWTPGSNTITHPGNRAIHFIAATQAYANHEFMAAARRNFG